LLNTESVEVGTVKLTNYHSLVIQAFFAMPILDWEAFSMSGVMTKHFWFYWAVAIPSTLIVMAFVLVFQRIQEKRNKEASEKARREVGFGV